MPERGCEEVLPFEMGDELPDFFLRKAALELNDTPERRERGLREMRDLIQTDTSILDLGLTDEFLLRYLTARKFDAQRAFAQLSAFVKLRRKYPDMYRHFRFEVTSLALDNQHVNILPWRCPEGCTVVLVQIDNWDTEALPMPEIKRLVTITVMGCVAEERMTRVNGFKIIFDMKSTNVRYLRYFTPHYIYLLYHGTHDTIPGRYKEIHFVNNSFLFRIAWIIIKQFITEKFRNRIHLHSSSETLLDFFPKYLLPVKYGGELENYSVKSWLKKVMEPDNIDKIFGGRWDL